MKFSIVKNSKIWFSFSAVLVFLSLALVVFGALKFSIDYTGGSFLELKFENEIARDEVSKIFRESLGDEKSEKILQIENGVQIRAKELADEEKEKFFESLKSNEIEFEILKAVSVGPSVGAIFKKRAAMSLIFAGIAIVAFLAFAFRRTPAGLSSWKFGIVAIVALLHDVLITIGVFAILGFLQNVEVDALFLTALLTVMGFSVHDTIVVFDRVRENLKGRKSTKNLPEIAEAALWQTMRRSIYTSVSTLIVLVFLLFFGGASLFYFTLALIVGIVVGTYSSIFLATPLLVFWSKK